MHFLFFSLMLSSPLAKGFADLKEVYLKWHSPKSKAKPSQAKCDLTDLRGKSLRPTKWGFSCRIFSSIKNAIHLQSCLNQYLFFFNESPQILITVKYFIPYIDIITETMWIKIDKFCNLESSFWSTRGRSKTRGALLLLTPQCDMQRAR